MAINISIDNGIDIKDFEYLVDSKGIIPREGEIVIHPITFQPLRVNRVAHVINRNKQYDMNRLSEINITTSVLVVDK
jgi:hypothetical protein